MSNCSGVKVLNNILRNSRYKMLIDNCSNCVFEDNFVTGGWEAIVMRDSDGNRFSRNLVYWCHSGPFPIGPFYGIILENCHENYFEYNEIADCNIGIALTQSRNNTFSHNQFFDEPWASSYRPGNGICLWSGSNGNVIVQNRFEGLYGLALIVDGHSCRIYHNDFIYTGADVVTSYINFWDDGYPSGGNYWSYFEFEDQFSGAYQNISGSDGIGDSQYVVNGYNLNNVDNYPLMGPWTETGENVTVVDGSGISVMFENVTSSGVTYVSEIMGGPEPPEGFTHVNESSICYEIRTTASYSGTVTIRIPYNDAGMAEKEEALISLLHWNETEQMWMNITFLVYSGSNFVQGITSNLSLFGLFWPFIWDVTGDGHVGIDDIVLVAEHFGQSPAHPEWNPICDINGDDYVGIDDVVAVAGHFGESI
jgi:parallel beta-helix repeat protein